MAASGGQDSRENGPAAALAAGGPPYASPASDPPTLGSIPASRYAIFFGIAVIGCATDLATKSWIFNRLGMPGPGQNPPIRLWDDVFSLTTSLNEGALFGMGQGLVIVFAGLSIVAAVGILYWLFFKGAAHDLWLTIALAAITGGIFGNLYDRLGLHGLVWNDPQRAGKPVYAVRDWLHFKVEGWIDWPVFNIADSLLVTGVGILLWHAFRQPAPPDGTKQNNNI